MVRSKFGGAEIRFNVIPGGDSGVPIHIHQPRQNTRNRYWDHSINSVKPTDGTFEFIDYFDWDSIGFLDFRFVRVQIVSFPAATEVQGREALIQAEYVQIGINEKIITDHSE